MCRISVCGRVGRGVEVCRISVCGRVGRGVEVCRIRSHWRLLASLHRDSAVLHCQISCSLFLYSPSFLIFILFDRRFYLYDYYDALCI